MTDLQKYRSKLLGLGFKNATPPLMEKEYSVYHHKDGRIEVYVRSENDEEISDHARFWFSQEGELLDD